MEKNKKKNGFTLIEIVVAVGIMAILAFSVSQLFVAMIKGISYYRERTTVSSLANQYLEIARNLPYSQVGVVRGVPPGSLPADEYYLDEGGNEVNNPFVVNFGGTDYQIYYVVTAIHDPADPNIGVQDYKQVKLYIKNVITETINSFVTTVAPISLSSMASGGVISVKVIDKSWQPVQGASITLTNTNVTPGINLNKPSTPASGIWDVIGLPPDSNYHIVVTKNGYSADQTYPADDYPGAFNPDVAVIDGQVQNVTFVIDQLSDLDFYTLNQTCQAISGVELNVQGTKPISPGVPKFYESYTSNFSGLISPASVSSCSSSCGSSSCCLEWDNYAPGLAGTTYMIYGTSPVQSVDLFPNTNQNFNLILGPKTDNSLLAVVKDSSGNTIQGARIVLSNPGLGYNAVEHTGGSVWEQTDWSGGWGQENWSLADEYFQDDGYISNNAIPLALRLAPGSEPYFLSGSLISSTFDTGTDQTLYTTLEWGATTEDPTTSVKFQIATSDCLNGATNYPDCDTGIGSWIFTGSDGTGSSYYNVSGTTISSTHNNKRYVRYEVFLLTTDQQKTPMLSNVSVNYISGCSTPGQAMFSGLSASDNYTITVSASEYQTQIIDNLSINGYFISQITLLPQ